ncbi:MAG: insulinase family protein [Muribaculaceae bacterium]|nr:insulinase family protein [Muribaculaceae bacterium]
MAAVCAVASWAFPDRTLQMDSTIVYGKLPNGLSYYIYPCHRPAYKVNLYLMEQTGCAVEEPNQLGMAHFLEHMAFNGSEHFPGASMVPKLESFGLSFGYDINAATGQDITTFHITGLDIRSGAGAVDTALLALCDISHALTLSDAAIDKERPIIIEEWRQGNDATERILQQMMPILYGADSRYCQLPIGDIDVLQTFTAKNLRDFYEKWYQPQHQAIIVIGSIDPDEVEAKIRELWGDITPKTEPSVRHWEQVPNHQGIAAGVVTDPEFPACQIDLWFKVDLPSRDRRNTASYINDSLLGLATSLILNQRLSALLTAPGTPWSAAESEYTQYYGADSKDSFRIYCLYDARRRAKALDQIVAQAKRIAVYGVTDDELDMARQVIWHLVERMPVTSDERNNYEQFDRISEHFAKGNVVLSTTDEMQTFADFADTITVDGLDAFISRTIRPDNLTAMMVEKAQTDPARPSSEALRLIVNKAWQDAQVEAPVADTSYRRPLFTVEPTPGSIVKWEVDTMCDGRRYVLSNGARVAVCRRDVLTDEVTVRAVARGGMSEMSGISRIDAEIADALLTLGGIGDFSALDLERKFKGRMLDIDVTFGPYFNAIDCTTTSDTAGLTDALRLMHLRLTTARCDSAVFDNYLRMLRAHIADMASDPASVFADSVSAAVYGPGNPMMRPIAAADVDTANYVRALDMARTRMANPAAYDFIIVGNVNYTDVEPLLERYIASLPGDGSASRPAFRPIDRYALPGVRRMRFSYPMSSPVTKVHRQYEARMPYTLPDAMAIKVLATILERTYIQTLREQSGGTYVPNVDYYAIENEGAFGLIISFDTNPEQAEQLLTLVEQGLRDVAENGPDPELFDAVRRYEGTNEYTATLQQAFPLNALTHLFLYDDTHQWERVNTIRSLTPSQVQQIAAALLAAPSQATVIMDGQ